MIARNTLHPRPRTHWRSRRLVPRKKPKASSWMQSNSTTMPANSAAETVSKIKLLLQVPKAAGLDAAEHLTKLKTEAAVNPPTIPPSGGPLRDDSGGRPSCPGGYLGLFRAINGFYDPHNRPLCTLPPPGPLVVR